MDLKQQTIKRVVGQFHQPRGLGGRAAGLLMAHRSSNRQRNAWAVSLLDVGPEDRVLEIGFGPGIAIRELTRRASRGLVCGIDHSDVMVRQATRRNAIAVHDGRVDLRLGSVSELPRFDEPFDKMLAVNSCAFWDDPTARLGELRDQLRPGGVIAIVSQPRDPNATETTSAGAGREIADQLTAAGFADLRTETLPLRPPVVCVLGVNAEG